jgi:hypothetical protein
LYENLKPIFVQTIRDAMEKDKTRVTADLNTFFGHKPGPAVIGDFEGFSHLSQTLIFLFNIVIKH